MTRPRPLTSDERRRLTTDLRALADELDRPDAGRTQQNLGVATDACYPATASGSGSNGGGGGGGDTTLTVVEARATRSDPTATATLRLLATLHRIRGDVPAALDGLAGWRSDRPTGLCAEGHPMKPGVDRCPVCWTRRETVLTCENPYHVDSAGQPWRIQKGHQRWKSVAVDLGGIEVLECGTCRTYRARNHRSWGNATRLNVTALGVYHSDEEPWAG